MSLEIKIRTLIKELSRNEQAYEDSKKATLSTTTVYWLEGRKKESEIIRIQLEKLLGEKR